MEPLEQRQLPNAASLLASLQAPISSTVNARIVSPPGLVMQANGQTGDHGASDYTPAHLGQTDGNNSNASLAWPDSGGPSNPGTQGAGDSSHSNNSSSHSANSWPAAPANASGNGHDGSDSGNGHGGSSFGDDNGSSGDHSHGATGGSSGGHGSLDWPPPSDPGSGDSSGSSSNAGSSGSDGQGGQTHNSDGSSTGHLSWPKPPGTGQSTGDDTSSSGDGQTGSQRGGDSSSGSGTAHGGLPQANESGPPISETAYPAAVEEAVLPASDSSNAPAPDPISVDASVARGAAPRGRTTTADPLTDLTSADSGESGRASTPQGSATLLRGGDLLPTGTDLAYLVSKTRSAANPYSLVRDGRLGDSDTATDTPAPLVESALPVAIISSDDADVGDLMADNGDEGFSLSAAVPRSLGVLSDILPLDLASLEAGIKHFFDQVEGLGWRLTDARTGMVLSSAVVAGAMAATALEAARRRRRRQPLAVAADGGEETLTWIPDLEPPPSAP